MENFGCRKEFWRILRLCDSKRITKHAMVILQSVETERGLTQRFGDGISEIYKVYIN